MKRSPPVNFKALLLRRTLGMRSCSYLSKFRITCVYTCFRRSWTKMTPTEAAAFHDEVLYTNWARELDHAFYEDWAEQLNDAWGLNYACGL